MNKGKNDTIDKFRDWLEKEVAERNAIEYDGTFEGGECAGVRDGLNLALSHLKKIMDAEEEDTWIFMIDCGDHDSFYSATAPVLGKIIDLSPTDFIQEIIAHGKPAPVTSDCDSQWYVSDGMSAREWKEVQEEVKGEIE